MTLFGDLGCPGVDVDKWRRENRVRLFPGKVNRWILVRTALDNPTADDLKTTLAFVFAKWFDGSFIDPGSPYNDTTRSDTADLIHLDRFSKERLTFRRSAQRREELPGPLPLLKSGEVVWLEVSFAYRGQVSDMPWPVRTGTTFVQLRSSADCPFDADWMLDSVAEASEPAPPEKSTGEKFREGLEEGAAASVDVLAKPLVGALWLPLLVLGGGLLLFGYARRSL